MKIVYLLPGGLYNAAGMERVITLKANYFADIAGYDVSIITTEQMGRPVYYPLSDKVHLYHLDIGIGKNFETESYLQKVVSRISSLREYKKRVNEVLMEIRPDVTISTLGGLDIEFINGLKDGSAKVGELHFIGDFRKVMTRKLYKSFIPNLVGEFMNRRFREKCSKLSRLVVLTEEEKSGWKNSEQQVTVIPNPSPIHTDKSAALDNKKAIAVGRLAYEKGFDWLIEVWAMVAEKHPDWRLDIFGSGNQKEILQQMIDERSLNEVIKINDPVPNIQEHYLNSSMLIFPSRYLDALPMVLIEALSCGLPLVAFDAPCGPKDVINDGENGFFVKTGEKEALADRICRLIESDELRKAMGLKAKLSSERYQIEPVMNQWISLFEELK